MHMLGIALTHLRQKVISLKDLCIAKALILLSHLKVIGAYLINLMIRFVIHISKRFALILWSIAQKCVPNTMKVAYRRAELTVVNPKLGQTGLMLVALAFLYPARVIVLLFGKIYRALQVIMEK
jgi:hypothetical protein